MKLKSITFLFFLCLYSYRIMAQDLIITEIMYDPNSAEDNWEWIEVFNNTESDLDMVGWVVDDINSVAHSSSNLNGSIPAKSAAVLYNADDISAADFTAAWGTSSNLIGVTNWSAMGLNNGGDQIGIWNSFTSYQGDNTSHNNVIHQVNYGASGFPDPVGSSIYLSDLNADNSIGSNWTGSQVGVATPLGTGISSQNAGGNIGTDIGSPNPGTTQPTLDLTINELRISSGSSSDNVSNYVEIFGENKALLDNYWLLVISGEFAPGQIDFAFDLSGRSIDEDQLILIANPDISSVITQAITESNDLLTNFDFFGSPATFLLVKGFTGTAGEDLDNDDDGNFDQTPWEVTIDGVSLVDGDETIDRSYSTTVVGPDGNFPPAGLFRFPNNTGAFNSLPFGSFNNDTPGVLNAGPQATRISQIQGTGNISPLEGALVTVEGIVVGDFQEDDGDLFGTDLDGFFVQEETDDYDDNPSTSEAIFVFAPGAEDVKEGQAVRVTGIVEEFFGLTELTNIIRIEILSDPDPAIIPTPEILELPLTDAQLESYENMLVVFPQSLSISEYFNFDRFGEIVLSLPFDGKDRIFQPTSYLDPDNVSLIENTLEEIETRRITLDDGRSNQNPDPARHPNGEIFNLDNRFRGGDLISNASGVLSFSFGRFRIQPTTGADYEKVNPRNEAPPPVGGDLKVAAFNVLNYFTTFGERGADNQAEFDRQRTKIIAALKEINADIVGLIEIENNDDAIHNLVTGLNEAMGSETYDYVETGRIGDDAIKVAFIFKPGTVATVGDYAILEEPADIFIGAGTNRVPLAQTFKEVASGGVFTVVVNHFKSKGSACGEGDDDPFQGNCNETRTRAAQAILEWLANDPTGSEDPDYMIIGDLNAYDKEDPITALKKGLDGEISTADDFIDLLLEFQGEYAYTYVFDGQWGYLDYIMVNQSLFTQITGVTEWHINADEADILDYDLSFKEDAQDLLYEPNPYRSSDHDPVIAGLQLATEAAQITDLRLLVNQTKTSYPIRDGKTFDAEALNLVTFKILTGNPPVDAKSALFELSFNGKTRKFRENSLPFVTGSALARNGKYHLKSTFYAHKNLRGQIVKEFENTFTIENFGVKAQLIENLTRDYLLKFYPNPVQGFASVNFSLEKAGKVEILIMDLTGNVVYSENHTLEAGANNLKLTLENLESGLYNCRIISEADNQFYQLNFIKK